MGKHQDLPIYKDLYAYVREIYKLKAKLPRTLKHDFGQQLFDSSIRCLRFVVITNGSLGKDKILRELLLELDFQWTGLRLLFELRGISSGEQKVLGELLLRIEKQAMTCREFLYHYQS